jgi:hypothetical protein
VAGPQHHALAEQGIRRHPQGAQVELDPIKRAALLIKLNELAINNTS